VNLIVCANGRLPGIIGSATLAAGASQQAIDEIKKYVS
jgi:hypothetical protein